MKYDDFYQTYYEQYLREFGERKVRKVTTIINNSKHTRNLLNQCFLKKISPNATDLRQNVLSNFKLAFANKATEIFAMSLLLKKFNDEVNIDDCIISQGQVIQVFSEFNSTFKY
ncbi:hypothetical protein MHL31_12510 [Lutibacter sp. A80]|uniref:hypothetical protein n=1 Tax=Lutibacter sp. A80 TaxID=2918453 RepID=UPI001F063317|nr:hypothetical protein [Lutibacter sp. A80]UMB59892.1 hypothetical protein MHL31_12510 [Lutibacter sp. A80]